MSGFRSLLDAIAGFFRSLFSRPAPAPQPPAPPSRDDAHPSATAVIRRALLVTYNPLVNASTGQKLFEIMGWRTSDSLATGFMADILETSSGLAGFQVVDRAEIN